MAIRMQKSSPRSKPVRGRTHPARLYQGLRTADGAQVTVNGRALDPATHMVNHSPTGLEWGYAGSGPAQLALALLVDHLGDPEAARSQHQLFKFHIVQHLPYDRWELTSAEIDEALEAITRAG